MPTVKLYSTTENKKVMKGLNILEPEYNTEFFTETGREATKTEAMLLNDYNMKNKIAYKLNQQINRVNIDHPVIVRAFKKYMEKSGDIGNFRLIDLLSFNESVRKRGFIYGNVGDNILVLSGIPRDKGAARYIYENSVYGLYELIDRTNGLSLSLSEISYDELFTTRFVFVSKSKALKILKKTMAEGISVKIIGKVISQKRIIFSKGDINEVDLPKSLIYRKVGQSFFTVNLSSGMFEHYKKSFLSVFFYKYCISAKKSCSVSIGSDMDLDRLTCTLLALNSASVALMLSSLKYKFTEGDTTGNIVNSVECRPGDRLYIVLPTYDKDGIPMRNAYNQIIKYLDAISSEHIIRAIIPVTNIEADINGLLGERFVLKSDDTNSFPEVGECSAIIVTPDNLPGKPLGTIELKE